MNKVLAGVVVAGLFVGAMRAEAADLVGKPLALHRQARPPFQKLHDAVTALGINEGTAGALQRRLERAGAALRRGDVAAARTLLDDFRDAVRAQRGKTLTDAQTDALAASAQALIDAL